MAGKRGAKGLGSVYQETDTKRTNRWVAERWVELADGRRKRVRGRGRTQAEALREADAKARRAARLNPESQHLTVAAHLQAWLEHKEAHVRASTMRAYRQDVRLHIRPALGRHKLARLQARHCQTVIDQLVTRGHHGMADRVRRTLKQALGQAVRWGLLPANPMDQVTPVRRPTPKRGTYTMRQLRQFLEATKATKYYPLFLLALSTGMRKGEVLALQWRDLTAEGVHVCRTVSAKATGDGTAPPKTPAGERFIPVHKDTMSVVLATRPKHASDSEWVFTTRNGKRHSVRTISRVMRTIQEREGLAPLRFHDFRRSYATLLAEQGHHPRVIQALLGHSTPTLAMTIYTEATELAKNRAHVDVHSGGQNGGRSSVRDRTRSEGEEPIVPPPGRSLEA